jgi:hypothetical protein
MYKDILNLNSTTKSILKNPDPKASLAYSNAILRKDPAKSNVEGIGLNPNVPLEDEYIQNLQKQIHFMDLEIKLMKEKSAQEEALGGNYNFAKMGLNDGKPSVDHIMTTTNKMKYMKTDLTRQTNLLDQDLLKQKELNTIALAKLKNLEAHVAEYDEKLGKTLSVNGEASTLMRTKLLTEKQQKEDVEIEIMKVKKVLDKVLDDNARLKKETELRKLYEGLAQKAFEEDEKMDEETSEAKIKEIDILQVQKAELFIAMEKDPELRNLRKENEDLQKRAKELEALLDRTNYKVLETETMELLSLKKKEEDQEIKKKLQAELDKWKDQLEETKKSNELKVERKLREAESPMIKEIQADFLKEKHELTELRTKLVNVDKQETEYFIDQANRTRYRDTLVKKKEENEAVNNELHEKIRALDPEENELKLIVEDLRIKNSEAREARMKLEIKLREVEEENITLLSKFQFLQKNINLEEDMKKFNIEELRSVVQANQTVNDTIADFMGKWDNLRKFSKQT